jgi:hypothetical protein
MKTITLSDKVRVSDPCYDNDVWCKTMLTGVLPGKFKVEVERSDEGDWGNRVARLFVKHEDYTHLNNWEDHSDIGVDSGQAGIFCESSYRNDIIAENIITPESDFHIVFDGEGEKWYEKMCKFTLSKDQSGIYETGVVTSSGYGDGSYPLEVIRESNGYIVGMMITYISPEDEVEDEDEDDEEYGGEA